MKPYIGLVHQDPDSAYGVTFPDAPGCFSAADSLDDLFVKAADALGLWLEVMTEGEAPLPDVRGLSDLRTDPDWIGSFGDATMIIAVQVPHPDLRTAA